MAKAVVASPVSSIRSITCGTEIPIGGLIPRKAAAAGPALPPLMDIDLSQVGGREGRKLTCAVSRHAFVQVRAAMHNSQANMAHMERRGA